MHSLRQIAGVALLVSLSLVAHSQPAQSQFVEEFREGAYQGCLVKQRADPLSKGVNSDAMEQLCSCNAYALTRQLLTLPSMQSAFGRRDENAILQYVLSAEFAPVIRDMNQRCIASLGPVENWTDKQALAAAASRTKGLKGDVRTNFVHGNVASCTAAFRAKGQSAAVSERNVVTYCQCFATDVADAISEYDVTQMLQSLDHATPDTKQAMDRAVQRCRQQITPG